ncbi:prepilin-type N-terminal cleavage/methylation domain-containing protein [Lentisphaera marina]|uniref:prepilin-type N-terminal cleavage/methylation domain-containing protein n=1 Tax=Lentisphaera marina TaxID=1111041 RepID=UPI002366BD16|nr:prepilin-type N-terminal cleavage/methylation domain-containing protein [Lentisphaera marina]MDD7987089.1 prepilin-type N-terminal cleavage/methylation domain-containing protein [Lentisphaera marina]
MRSKKNSFTLIEMMMVLGIVAILFGIGTAVFTIATGKSEIAKAKSEIAQLKAAVEMYYDRWGQYPLASGADVNEEFNFGEWLSKVAADNNLDNNWTGKRPMFIKFNEQGYDVSNVNYDEDGASSTVVNDPWGTPYGYSYHNATNSFIIYSVGTFDDIDGDLSASWNANEWQFSDDSNGPFAAQEAQDVGIISSHLK